MPWVRFDDQFPEHPKVVSVGPLGIALQVAAVCYCNRHLTDGFLPWSAAQSLLAWEFCETPNENGQAKRIKVCVSCGMSGDDVDTDYVIGLLISAGIWEEVSGGYRVHDYLDYQLSKAQVEAIRAQKIAAGQAGGQASAQARAQAKV